MGQRLNTNDAAAMDVQITLKKEECASSMGQSTNDAAMKDVQVKLRKEECASSMGQHGHRKDAAVKDAQV